MILANPISVSEIGTLWQTYQEKTLIMRMLEYFIEKTDDAQARNILGGLWQELNFYVLGMEDKLMMHCVYTQCLWACWNGGRGLFLFAK